MFEWMMVLSTWTPSSPLAHRLREPVDTKDARRLVSRPHDESWMISTEWFTHCIMYPSAYTTLGQSWVCSTTESERWLWISSFEEGSTNLTWDLRKVQRRRGRPVHFWRDSNGSTLVSVGLVQLELPALGWRCQCFSNLFCKLFDISESAISVFCVQSNSDIHRTSDSPIIVFCVQYKSDIRWESFHPIYCSILWVCIQFLENKTREIWRKVAFGSDQALSTRQDATAIVNWLCKSIIIQFSIFWLLLPGTWAEFTCNFSSKCTEE